MVIRNIYFFFTYEINETIEIRLFFILYGFLNIYLVDKHNLIHELIN